MFQTRIIYTEDNTPVVLYWYEFLYYRFCVWYTNNIGQYFG